MRDSVVLRGGTEVTSKSGPTGRSTAALVGTCKGDEPLSNNGVGDLIGHGIGSRPGGS